MKPKKVTIEGEREAQLKAFCDEILHRAASLMIEQGAPLEMMLDRVITFATAHACSVGGSTDNAAMYRTIAEKIDAGLFHSVTREGKKGH